MKKSFVLSTAISLLAASPCYAVDWDGLVNSLIGNRGHNSFSVSDQNQLKTLIGDREAQIEQNIEAGVRAGTITPAEEQELRNSLNDVERHEGQFLADGTLSETEARSLVDELSRLNLKVNAYITNSTTTGYANVPDRRDHGWGRGNAYGYWTHHGHDRDHDSQDDPAPNQVQVQAMIDSKQAELDSSISRGALNGSLTDADARNLRYALSQVASSERKAQADGVLSNREQTDLTTQLNDLDARLKAMTRVPSRGGWGGHSGGQLRSITSYRKYLHDRITNALSSGKITRDQAKNLFYQERRIGAIEEQARQDGMTFTYDEQRGVLAKLDQLSAQIDAVAGVGVR